uniref:Uncharacterized protein n=1 Tax=Arundo donax TaxID=35708 RepID=A0A0A9B1V3_ARUDO
MAPAPAPSGLPGLCLLILIFYSFRVSYLYDE